LTAVGDGHGHHTVGDDVSDVVLVPGARRAVLLAVVPFIVATIAALILLWPRDEVPTVPGQVRYGGTLESVTECPPTGPEGEVTLEGECLEGTVRMEDGPDAGQVIRVLIPVGFGAPEYSVGDEVVLAYVADAPPEFQYDLVDYQRGSSLIWLALVFVFAVVLLSRWKGVSALLGLGASALILVAFVMPALLTGQSPLLVAVVGAAAIMIATLYLAHGPSVRTSVALLGTLCSLTLTGLIGAFVLELGRFTRLGDEAAQYIGLVDPRGLLLAGLVIGALGVLDDVTVTQTAAVWEVVRADPSASRRQVWAAGMRVGRDHVAATVNTLVLAYAGAALPLLLLLQVSEARIADVLTSELVAQEVVRSLCGGLGIVAAVPITTALATWVTAGHVAPGHANGRRRRRVRLG
jgi:uncharacterized membrane protein